MFITTVSSVTNSFAVEVKKERKNDSVVLTIMPIPEASGKEPVVY